jgi:hypothetical protein
MGRDWDWEEAQARRPSDDEDKSGCGWKIITVMIWPLLIVGIGAVEYLHPWS